MNWIVALFRRRLRKEQALLVGQMLASKRAPVGAALLRLQSACLLQLTSALGGRAVRACRRRHSASCQTAPRPGRQHSA